MLGGKSLANDTSHCGRRLGMDACLLLEEWRFIWKWPYAPEATWWMRAGQPLAAVHCISTAIITHNITSRRAGGMIERMIVAIADSAGADVWDNCRVICVLTLMHGLQRAVLLPPHIYMRSYISHTYQGTDLIRLSVRLVFESVVNKIEATHIDWDGFNLMQLSAGRPRKDNFAYYWCTSWLVLWIFKCALDSLSPT